MDNLLRGFLRVRAYLRYSTHNQDDGYSIEYQMTEIEEFATMNGYDLEKLHIDQAQTATKTAGRDEFFMLMNAVKRNEVDIIIVYKTSRIFRNSYESHKYRELFLKHNVKFISVTQTIDETTPEGRFMTSTIANVDQYQAETTSDHVKSSMREMARQGYYTGGRVLYGYKLQENSHGGRTRKKYAPDEMQAEIVKRIFTMFADGRSVVDIMNCFISENIRNRKGNYFNEQNIRQMLKNDCYIGTMRYSVKGYDEIVTKNAHEPIISDSLWQSVQYQFSKAKQLKPRKKKYFYPLTGKIFCGCCGTHFFGCSSSAVRGVHRYVYHSYVCRKKRSFRNCTNPQIKKEQLEETVLQAIKMKILNPTQIDLIIFEVIKFCENSPSDTNEQIKTLTLRKKEIVKQLNILVDMRINGEINSDIVKMRSATLENELLEIEKNLFSFSQQQKTKVSPNEVKCFLQEMIAKSENCTEEVLKALFDCFVESVTVSPHEIKVNLRVFSAPEFAYKPNFATPIFELYAEIYR